MSWPNRWAAAARMSHSIDSMVHDMNYFPSSYFLNNPNSFKPGVAEQPTHRDECLFLIAEKAWEQGSGGHEDFGPI